MIIFNPTAEVKAEGVARKSTIDFSTRPGREPITLGQYQELAGMGVSPIETVLYDMYGYNVQQIMLERCLLDQALCV